MSLSKYAIVTGAAALAFSTTVGVAAVPTGIDGLKGAEWEAPAIVRTRDAWNNGANADDGWVRSVRRLAWDDRYVYLSFEGVMQDGAAVGYHSNGVDLTNPPQSRDLNWSGRTVNAVNAYLYGSGGSAVYGDLDDMLIEGVGQWGFGSNGDTIARGGDGTGVYMRRADGTPGAYALSRVGTSDVYADETNGVYVGFLNNGSTNFYEVAVDRGLIDFDDYAAFRFGGQAWSYGFTYTTAPVPEPAAASVLLITGLLALRRRRA